MAYTTITELLEDVDREFLLQFVNDENRDTGVIDLDDVDDVCTKRVQKCIDDGAADIDPYLAPRYTTPINPIPPVIAKLNRRKALKHLYERRVRDNMPDSILKQDAQDVRFLEMVGKGQLPLPGVDEPAVSDGRYTTNKSVDDKYFNDDALDMI